MSDEYNCVVTFKHGACFKADLQDIHIANIRACDDVKSVTKGEKV